DVYEKVRGAIGMRRVLRCRYQASHSLQKDSDSEIFEFRPYVLWYCQRAFYAVGFHCGRRDIRQLKLSRFDYVEVTEKPFAVPDDFSMETYLGNAWRMIKGEREYRVVIRFDKEFAAAAAETRWHHTQEEAWDEDGALTLSFKVLGLEEIQWWVLGYGPHAHVLEPKNLAAKVRELARATARRYEAGPRRGA
ncbi:MAG TPA: WYL domain-containing protein, partial [Verrucomicrobiae bacterium]|nr:WYL domain-containing protein [Verrucomicrobiae bacterium]